MGVSPGPNTDVTAPDLGNLATAVLQSTVNTIPRSTMCRWACRRNGVSGCGNTNIPGRRTTYRGGAESTVQETKRDIVALYFHDYLLTELDVLKDSRRSDMKFIFGNIAEELLPLLSRILPPDSEAMSFVDYTASRVVQRREVLKNIPSDDVPCTLIYTFHDDNVGVLTQLAIGSLHELTKDLRLHGWSAIMILVLPI